MKPEVRPALPLAHTALISMTYLTSSFGLRCDAVAIIREINSGEKLKCKD